MHTARILSTKSHFFEVWQKASFFYYVGRTFGRDNAPFHQGNRVAGANRFVPWLQGLLNISRAKASSHLTGKKDIRCELDDTVVELASLASGHSVCEL